MQKQHLSETHNYLKNKGIEAPEIGIVLGTGLGKLTDHIKIETTVAYDQIPHFPLATVEFHSGKLIYGTLSGKKVLVMQGRFHLYEDYTAVEVTYPIRVMRELGIKKLLVSNAAGAVNLDYNKGDLMLIEDHINLQGTSPLVFKNISEFGNRFVDMSAPYDLAMGQKLTEIAFQNKIELHKGVYAAVLGPQLETKAEYRMLKTLGADAVGMSTVPEVIIANHLNLPVVAVSVITDIGNPDNLQPINIKEIIEIIADAEPKMIQLFKNLLANI